MMTKQITILQVDETENGHRMRRTLTDKHGIDCLLEKEEVDNGVNISLYGYIRPSNGQKLWLVETSIFIPPDVELFRAYVLDGEPSGEQIRDIAFRNPEKGSMLP